MVVIRKGGKRLATARKLTLSTKRTCSVKSESSEQENEQNQGSAISKKLFGNSSSEIKVPAQENFNFEGIQYSPYFLTSGDNPGTPIITEILDGTNYTTWSIAMNIALDAKNKISFVDGSLPRPYVTHPHYKIWSRCNSMVKSWILNSVNKQIYGSILRFEDASEIWKNLLVRFHITNLPRSYQLTQQIWSLQQGSMNLSTYYTKLKTLWDELEGAECINTCKACECCKKTATKSDHIKVIKFLAGLNESYSNARSQIIMRKRVPDLAEVYNVLDSDHCQRSMTLVPSVSACSFDEKKQADVVVNAVASTRKNQKPTCAHCGYTGHSIEKCYKIHGYPPGFKHKQKQEAVKSLTKDQIEGVISYFNSQLTLPTKQDGKQAASKGMITAEPGIEFSNSILHFVGAMKDTGSVLSAETWVIDSGATHHVTADRNCFVHMNDIQNKSVTLPNGLDIRIAGIGEVKINSCLVLRNVLYIPEFRMNLLSVSQLTTDLNCRVVFDPLTCVIQEPIKGLMIGRAEQVSNLYFLDKACFSEDIVKSLPFFVNLLIDSSLWHNRLGHPSVRKVDSIMSFLGIEKKSKENFHCSICPLAKQKRLPFKALNNMCEKPFDLLHIDVWGPFSVSTLEGYRYFITIVDDFSRVTWVYLMRLKSDVLQVFPAFLKMVETQYQATVKGVRSDNAPELKFEELYKSKGIQAYHSCPETPEQNSVVERKHQHILNVARSLMFQSSVPLEYWGDCVLTAVFLINRLPATIVKDKSPYELLNGRSQIMML